jgi:nitroreductase
MTQMKSMAELYTVIRNRRATAHFKPNGIPIDILNEIFDLARLAPSGYNLQPWRFIVVRDEGNRQRLQKAAMNQEKVGEAPVVIIACADTTSWKTDIDRVINMGMQKGSIPSAEIAETMKQYATQYLNSVDINVWATKQLMIAFTHIMLVAEAYGIDTAPMEGFDENQVREAFNIPPNMRVIALLAMGYREGTDRSFPGRFETEEVFFQENFNKGWTGRGS